MTTLMITIDTASLLSDCKVKSFMHTQRVKDPDDRYAMRASEENESELKQDLQDAWRQMLSIVRRFLNATTDSSGNDDLGTTFFTTDQTLSFDLSARRTSNIAASLSEAIHEYLVAGTLRRFYTSAAAAELANMYVSFEKVASDNIIKLLCTKAEPVYSS